MKELYQKFLNTIIKVYILQREKVLSPEKFIQIKKKAFERKLIQGLRTFPQIFDTKQLETTNTAHNLVKCHLYGIKKKLNCQL